MVTPLIALMQGESALSRGTTPQALTVQVRAKDAAYVLLGASSPDDRRRLEDAMIAWVMADLNTRWLAGEHNTAEVVRAVGSRAVPVILRVLTPEQLLLKNLTELVRDVGDDAGKASVSARLAQIGQAQLPRVQGRTMEAMAVLGGRPVVEFLLGMAE